MLLILMYHRVHGQERVAGALRTHLSYLKGHHPVVLPGDPLPTGETSVCLTFDDATADFYQQVYPLLQELGLRAMVAVPTAYIAEDTADPADRRLAAQQQAVMSGDYAVAGTPLCTWRELREMCDSGLVRCASHSHSHANLAAPGIDLEKELSASARALEEHLDTHPDTLVYPFGKTNAEVQRRVSTHYRYAMRIGSAANKGWGGKGGMLYRVDAEHFWPGGGVWSLTDTLRFRLKYLGNRLRGK